MEKKENVITEKSEKIKKGKYRVYNGTGYDILYLETSADQIKEDENKKFVSQAEKNSWNLKANNSHKHQPTDIIQNANNRFVSDIEKARWDNTYAKEEVNNNFVAKINAGINDLNDLNDFKLKKSGTFNANTVSLKTKGLPTLFDDDKEAYFVVQYNVENQNNGAGSQFITCIASSKDLAGTQFYRTNSGGENNWSKWKKIISDDVLQNTIILKNGSAMRYTDAEAMSITPKLGYNDSEIPGIQSLKVGDYVIITSDIKDRIGMKVTIMAKIIDKDSTWTYIQGLGMATDFNPVQRITETAYDELEIKDNNVLYVIVDDAMTLEERN